MKIYSLTLLFCLSWTLAMGQDAPDFSRDFHDPRHVSGTYTWIENGVKREDLRLVDHSILIICWMPDTSLGGVATYQVSGIEGRHSEVHTKRFLAEFFALENSKGREEVASNVIIVGTNWGAGIRLEEKLKELSKKHSFSVFYAGGRPFRRFHLIDEPESRLLLLREAHKRATKSEQVSADQPATAPPSESEGNTKPQRGSKVGLQYRVAGLGRSAKNLP